MSIFKLSFLANNKHYFDIIDITIFSAKLRGYRCNVIRSLSANGSREHAPRCNNVVRHNGGWRRRGAGAPVATPGPSQQPGDPRRMSMPRVARPSGGAEVFPCLVYTRHD